MVFDQKKPKNSTNSCHTQTNSDGGSVEEDMIPGVGGAGAGAGRRGGDGGGGGGGATLALNPSPLLRG